jgi:AcrR family transcriptional regulator
MPRAGLDSDSVVAAAAELADSDGLAGLTLARLARRLGVRAPSLYEHVDGLEDLHRRLALRGVRQLTVVLAAAAAGRSRREALSAVAWAYRDYAHAHPGSYAAAQRAPDDDATELADAAREFVSLIAAVLREYELEGEQAIHAVRIMRAALHGFVSLEAEHGFALPVSVPDTYERLIVMLDRGFAEQGDDRAGVASGP